MGKLSFLTVAWEEAKRVFSCPGSWK